MMTALYILAYIIIGLIIGRGWYAVCKRRKYTDLSAMWLAVGVFWPMMIVVVPCIIALVLFIERFGIPATRWLFARVDSVVNRIVPAKHG